TADVARMIIQAATAALLLSHTAHIWELVVLQALAGTGTAFFNPASTGLTPMTVSPERLQEANALRGISMASMQFLGPALAGILIVTVGPGSALAIDAASTSRRRALPRVSAYDWFGSLLCQPLGLALAGLVAAGIGMSRTLWIAAAIDFAALVGMLATPSVRHLRSIDRPIDQPA